MQVINAGVIAPEAKIAIVIARFNNFINNHLLDSALDTLKRIGQVQEDNITVIWIPGSYELSLTALTLAKTNKYDGIIALGTIIKGNTFHFKHIANETSSGIMNIAINCKIPIAFGVLTTTNIIQAIERSGMKAGNKGTDAALTLLEMINVIKTINT